MAIAALRERVAEDQNAGLTSARFRDLEASNAQLEEKVRSLTA